LEEKIGQPLLAKTVVECMLNSHEDWCAVKNFIGLVFSKEEKKRDRAIE